MLAALGFQEADHVPCCFSAFSSLREKCAGQEEYVDRSLEMGLDVAVSAGDLPVRHGPDVRTRVWREDSADTPYPVLHKVYETPAGDLRTSLRKSDDWPWGDRVPFMDDFLIPRSKEFLFGSGDSIDALCHLLAPPTEEDIAAIRERARRSKDLAARHGLLVTGGTGMAGDAASWVSGIEEVMLLTVDQPEFVRGLLAVVEAWNRRRMEVVLDQGVDLFIRRGWYENADFWSPQHYREFLLPGLRRDAEQVHEAGAKLGYIMSCSVMPLVDMMLEAGVDVLMGVDPAQDRTMDLRVLKEQSDRRMALWGGVCGYLTVERGTPDEISEQVRQAITVLGPGGGFILAPVTNVRADTRRAWENVRTLISTWKSLREYPLASQGNGGRTS